MTSRTYVLIDGENLDTTLGTVILKHRPEPGERPRWERVIEFAEQLWQQQVTGLFFLNASSGQVPWPFVNAIQNVGFRAVLLSGAGSEKVVDLGIQRTLDALAERDGDVLLGSHDRDFLPHLQRLADQDRQVAVLGFTELMSGGYAEAGIPVHDLEYDVHAFNVHLPRIRIIPVHDFDPAEFLD